MAVTKERLNEIFNKMTADQELTPEYMDELTAYQAEILGDPDDQIDDTEIKEVRERVSTLEKENSDLKAEIRKRFFTVAEDAQDVDGAEDTEEDEEEETVDYFTD